MPCGERSLFRGCLEKGNKMFDKLKAVESRFEEINARLLEPDVVSDNAVYRSLMKEYRNLEPIVEKFREYQSWIPPSRRRVSCWSREDWIRTSSRSWRRNTARQSKA